MPIKSLILLLLYVPILLLGGAQMTICVTEDGRMQIEFGFEECEGVPVSSASSAPAEDCGDCTDSRLTIGETHRVTIGHNLDSTHCHNVMVSQACDQEQLPAPAFIELTSFSHALIGSSILII